MHWRDLGRRIRVQKINKGKIEKSIEKILNILYPPTCPICGEILKINNYQVCKECKKKIKYIHEPVCKKCGKQLLVEEQEYCYDCSRREHVFTRGMAIFAYDQHVKKSIYRFKYNNKREYAKIYANEIALNYGRQILKWKADGIVPIPIHKSKLKSRGFNMLVIREYSHSSCKNMLPPTTVITILLFFDQ